MTPLSPGGARTVHAGKGSQSAPMAARAAITQRPGTAPPTMNNYAKATPMAKPTPGLGMGAGMGTSYGAGLGGIPPGLGK
ncbi:MAG TPA: hypothetical protein VNG33_17780 [Polyangiaceae bacterium]|nr:hypothetical protein [Polyangiaceae bacterium]